MEIQFCDSGSGLTNTMVERVLEKDGDTILRQCIGFNEYNDLTSTRKRRRDSFATVYGV